MPSIIYRAGCWGCLRSQEDPQQKYVCPQLAQHWAEYEKEKKYENIHR